MVDQCSVQTFISSHLSNDQHASHGVVVIMKHSVSHDADKEGRAGVVRDDVHEGAVKSDPDDIVRHRRGRGNSLYDGHSGRFDPAFFECNKRFLIDFADSNSRYRRVII